MWGMFPRILLWLCVVCAAAAAPTGAELASNPEVASALRVLEAWRSGVFRLESKRGGAAVGELVSFEEDSQGRVVRIKVGDNYSQRVERW
jgi:hypothetical protein